MNAIRVCFALLICLLSLPALAGGKITIAAAADLKFALEEILVAFRQANPADEVETIYGSSGKFHTQIQQGAPFDLYFSADIEYPRLLAKEGLSASAARPYAVGRIVLWSVSRDARQMTLADLANPAIRKIAIANPRHAPYGKRAEEALRAAGVWDKVESRLVMGENIAQTAQYVQTGNADVGIIALSLALNKELATKGGYALIPSKLHQPLEQGFIITKRAAGNPLAKQFADTMDSPEARRIMVRWGFTLPQEATR
ncbi:MAG: molybdate ABC transporter substrate-binding protein [Sulfuritalea sp.]|nr:molybdate ABC transporter substrate-binding protein [Sulfuritalea sp.]